MEGYKREFIQFLENAGVLKFGDFTAKSGRKIPYFINAGMIKTGSDIATLGEFYARSANCRIIGTKDRAVMIEAVERRRYVENKACNVAGLIIGNR